MTETLANWYSTETESTQQELSNEYQHGRVGKIIESDLSILKLCDSRDWGIRNYSISININMSLVDREVDFFHFPIELTGSDRDASVIEAGRFPRGQVGARM